MSKKTVRIVCIAVVAAMLASIIVGVAVMFLPFP